MARWQRQSLPGTGGAPCQHLARGPRARPEAVPQTLSKSKAFEVVDGAEPTGVLPSNSADRETRVAGASNLVDTRPSTLGGWLSRQAQTAIAS